MMKQFFLFLVTTATLATLSCSKDEGIPDSPNTINLAKQWFVRVQGPGTTSNYSLFSTRSTFVVEIVDSFFSQRQRLLADTITLDDQNQLVPSLRANVRINAATRTFGEGQYRNWHSPDSVLLKEGRIFRDGGRSRSGRVVDSIYLRYAFKSAPSVDYTLKGHARTGLVDDEY